MDKSTLLLLAIALAVFGASVAAGYPSWGVFTGLAIILLAAGLAAGALPMHSDAYFDERAGRNQRISKSVVTLSSAAVVAIYLAGYHRTSVAARRFDEQAEQRRKLAQAANLLPPTANSAAPPAASPAAPVRPSPSSTTPKKQSARKSPGAGGKSGSATASQPNSSEPESAEQPNAAAAEDGATSQPAAPRYKDGMYLGRGSCPHGDIEASVSIEKGRIVSATITQCLTRYSCSWISPRVPSDVLPDLPRQVVQRQSAKVDYVSGATESSDAFADAISAALAKALE